MNEKDKQNAKFSPFLHLKQGRPLKVSDSSVGYETFRSLKVAAEWALIYSTQLSRVKSLLRLVVLSIWTGTGSYRPRPRVRRDETEAAVCSG